MRLGYKTSLNKPYDSFRNRICKVAANAIPVAVLLAGLFLPLQEITRQALIGVVLIWIYLGVLTDFNYLW